MTSYSLACALFAGVRGEKRALVGRVRRLGRYRRGKKPLRSSPRITIPRLHPAAKLRELTRLPVAERSLDGCRRTDAFGEKGDAVVTPEQFAVENHRRYAEHADRFRLGDDAIVLVAGWTLHIGLERRHRAAKFRNHAADFLQLVELQFVIPEALENRVMVGAENAVTLGKQHAGACIECIIDSPRALNREALSVGIAPGVHIGVANLAPEVRGSILDRAHEFRDSERVGQPLQFYAFRCFQLEQRLVGDKGKGALVVGVDPYARLFHRRSFIRRQIRSWDCRSMVRKSAKRISAGSCSNNNERKHRYSA